MMRAFRRLLRLREASWRATSARPTPVPFVLHDDMFDDCDILPASAAGWCAQQLAEIAASSARHQRPDGSGWSDVHIRPAAPATVAGLAIPYAAAAETIGRLLPEFEDVIASGFTDPRPLPIRGRAFGRSPLAAVVIYHDDAGRHVLHIALTLRAATPADAEMLAALAAIPAPEPLMIVNWARSISARLDHADEVAAYLAGASAV